LEPSVLLPSAALRSPFVAALPDWLGRVVPTTGVFELVGALATMLGRVPLACVLELLLDVEVFVLEPGAVLEPLGRDPAVLFAFEPGVLPATIALALGCELLVFEPDAGELLATAPFALLAFELGLVLEPGVLLEPG
jgi:hypothetical protein